MSIEHLKIIVDLLKGVTDGALYGAILYMILPFIEAVLKYSLIAFCFVKFINALKVIALRRLNYASTSGISVKIKE